MNEWMIEQLPWKLEIKSAIATFAMHEALDWPIILKNGSKAYPQGFLKFLKTDAETLKAKWGIDG